MCINYGGMYKKLENSKGKRTLNSSITIHIDDTVKRKLFIVEKKFKNVAGED